MPFRKPQAGFMFPEAFSTVLTNQQVTREALRVFGVLLKHVGWNNRSVVSVKEIGVHLGIAPQHVSRGMAVLRAQQIVLPSTRRGEFELHPALFHVGSLGECPEEAKMARRPGRPAPGGGPMTRDQSELEEGLARIRGLLAHPVRYEDPECCLWEIGEIIQELLGDTPGIPPFGEGEPV